MPQDRVIPLNREKILKRAQEAFFAALLDGYAGGENRKSTKTVSNNGCTKTVTFVGGDYTVVDEWDIYPDSDKSAGATRILFCNKPIWRMFYGGHYPEGAIPFLKSALAKAYEKRLFLGGRGLAKMIDTNHQYDKLKFHLVYINNWNGDFQSFNGTEKIFQNPLVGYDPELIGYHQYFGMSII